MKIKLFGAALVARPRRSRDVRRRGRTDRRHAARRRDDAGDHHPREEPERWSSIRSRSPGRSFGWHTHGSAVAVVVTAGTLTVFDPDGREVRAVQGVEGPGVHRARRSRPPRTERQAKTRSRFYAMYLGIPKGALGEHAGHGT